MLVLLKKLLSFIIGSTICISSLFADQITIKSSADTIVNADDPNTNWGNNDIMIVGDLGNPWWSLISWDLASYPELQNATINSATIRLNQQGHSSANYSVNFYIRSVNSSWNENTVTWNNKPSTSFIETSYWNVPYYEGDIWREFSSNAINNYVQALIDNNSSSLSICLEEFNNSVKWIYFYSKEESSSSAPQLVINYTPNATQNHPNLTPHQHTGWSDKIVVSINSGDHTDDSPLFDNQNLYLDWGVANFGEAPISQRFFTELWVDGNLNHKWYTDSLDINHFTYVEDHPLGLLPVGTHTIEIRTDTENTIQESDETDNSYSKTISVTPTRPDPDLVRVEWTTTDGLSPNQPIRVTIEAQNLNGTGLNDSAINCSVIFVDGSTDLSIDNVSASWADETIILYPGQGPIHDSSCQPMVGGAIHPMIEAVDNNWGPGESHTLSFDITPNKSGTLLLRARVNLRDGISSDDCPFINDISTTGGFVNVDQQSWPVKEYSIEIGQPEIAISPNELNIVLYSEQAQTISNSNTSSVEKISNFQKKEDVQLLDIYSEKIDLTDTSNTEIIVRFTQEAAAEIHSNMLLTKNSVVSALSSSSPSRLPRSILRLEPFKAGSDRRSKMVDGIMGIQNMSAQVTSTTLQDVIKKNSHPKGPIGLFVASIDPSNNIIEICQELEQNPDIVYAHPSPIRHISEAPNDEFYDRMWNLSEIRASEAWNISGNQLGEIRVCVIDTGVRITHEEFEGRIADETDVVSSNGDAYADDDPENDDTNGHGTACAGIIAGTRDNGDGIAGIAPVTIIPVNAHTEGTGIGQYHQGIYWAVNQNADIISMSFGGQNPSQVERDAVEFALENNVMLIAAAGNDDGDADTQFPAAFDGVISVAAVDDQLRRVSRDNWGWGSNFGDTVDICAPGQGDVGIFDDSILTTGNTSDTAIINFFNGTSSATPQVAGLAALIMHHNPELSPEMVQSIIESTARDQVGTNTEDTEGWDQFHGHGLIDAQAAMQVAGQVFTITNEGSGVLEVTSIVLDNSSSWISSWSPTSPFTIPAGESSNVRLSLDTSAVGNNEVSDKFTIYSDDSDESPYPNAVEVSLRVVSLETDVTSLEIEEGFSNAIQLRLTSAPIGPVIVRAERTSGDSDIEVVGNDELAFSSANWSEWQSFTIEAEEDADQINGSANIHCSADGFVGIDITVTEQDSTPNNQAPSIDHPMSFLTPANSVHSIQGVSFNDPDAGENNVNISMTTEVGTIEVDTIQQNGLSGNQVTNNSSRSVSILAPISAINTTFAATSGLNYHTELNYVGSDTLTIQINDQGNTGAGGPLSASSDVDISVTGSAYAQWLFDSFGRAIVADSLLESTVWGKQANPDFDQFMNLQEYIFGLNPLSQNSMKEILKTGFTTIGNQTFGTYLYRKPTNISYGSIIPKTSIDLINWNSGAAYFQQIGISPEGTDYEWISMRDLLPVDENPRFFKLETND